MQIRKIGPNSYHLDVQVRGHGRLREIFTGSLHQARERIVVLKGQIRSKEKGSPSLTFNTFAEVLDFYWVQRFQYRKWSKTGFWLYRTLKQELGDIKLSNLNSLIFETWLAGRESKLTKYKRLPKPETINKYITIAKASFNLLVTNEYLPKNPLRFVKYRKPKNIQRRILSHDEFLRLYAEIPEYLRHWLEFIYKHPSRKSEILGLRNPNDISLTEGVLYLDDTRSKTGEGRILIIPDSMMDYFKSIPAASPWVFYRPELHSDGKTIYHRLDERNVLQTIQRAAKRLSISGVNVHMFRRTSAVNLLRKGVDIKTLSMLGGWKDYRTLFTRYLPMNQTDLKKAIDGIDVQIGKKL